MSEAGPNHCVPEVEPDPPATPGGIPGCQLQFFLVPPTKICGFLFDYLSLLHLDAVVIGIGGSDYKS